MNTITIPDGCIPIGFMFGDFDAVFGVGRPMITPAVQAWLRDGEREAKGFAEQTGGPALNANAGILALAIKAHVTGNDRDSMQGSLRLTTGIAASTADEGGPIVTVIDRPARHVDADPDAGDGEPTPPATARVGSLKGTFTVPDPESWAAMDADVQRLFLDEDDPSDRQPGALRELSEHRVRPKHPTDEVLAEVRGQGQPAAPSAAESDNEPPQRPDDGRTRRLEEIAGPLWEQERADLATARAAAAALGAECTRYGGVFPLNVTGVVDGRAFYFRLRHQQWRIQIAGPDAPLDDPSTHDDPAALVIATSDELCAPGSKRVDPATVIGVIVARIRRHLLAADCEHPGAITFCPLCGALAAATDQGGPPC
ncbi:MAG: hypothetical protein WCP28_22125 [Actinomycetes bacterium]